MLYVLSMSMFLREMRDHWAFDMFREGLLKNSLKQKDNFILTNFMEIRDPKCGAASTVSSIPKPLTL